MRNRWIKYTGTLACVCIQCLCIIAQDIDYRELKKGDVLPNGDSITFIRKHDVEKAELFIELIVKKTSIGKKSRIISIGSLIKEIGLDTLVLPGPDFYTEAYISGEVITFDYEGNRIGGFNVIEDFGWENALWSEDGFGPPVVEVIDRDHIIITYENQLRIVNKYGKTVFHKTDIPFHIETSFYLLHEYTLFIDPRDWQDKGYFLLFDLAEKQLVNEAGTHLINDTLRCRSVFYSHHTGRIFIYSNDGLWVTDMNMKSNIQIPVSRQKYYYFLNTPPLEMGDTIILFTRLGGPTIDVISLDSKNIINQIAIPVHGKRLKDGYHILPPTIFSHENYIYVYSKFLKKYNDEYNRYSDMHRIDLSKGLLVKEDFKNKYLKDVYEMQSRGMLHYYRKVNLN